jgi:hypothetical protein
MEMQMDTTQSGVPAAATSGSLEDQFQGLFEAGAFDLANKHPEQTPGDPQPSTETQNDADQSQSAQALEDAQKSATGQEETQSEETTYQTLDDFLTAQKVDPESFKTLPVTVKIDGETKLVPLQDVLKSYQLEGHVNHKSQQLSEAQKAFETEQQAARTIIQNQLLQNKALADAAQNMLTQEFQRVDWNALRVQNPAEYAAKWTEFQQRQGQIQNYLQGVQAQHDAMQQQQQASLAQTIQAERERLLNVVPEWRDTERFAADSKRMIDAGKQLGFSEAELSQIYDHRIMRVLHLAASQLGLQAAKPEALKKVRAAPQPTSKPGTRNIQDPKVAQRTQVFERVNSNPRDADALAAAFELLAS